MTDRFHAEYGLATATRATIENHGAAALFYANAAARVADVTGFLATDVTRVLLAIDVDTQYVWRLIDDSPITWKRFGDADLPLLEISATCAELEDKDQVVVVTGASAAVNIPLPTTMTLPRTIVIVVGDAASAAQGVAVDAGSGGTVNGTRYNTKHVMGLWEIVGASATGPAWTREPGVCNRGAYSAGATYEVGDIVSNGGSSYICTAQTTGNAPPNATYFDPLTSDGLTPAAGPSARVTITAAGGDITVLTTAAALFSASSQALTLEINLELWDATVQEDRGSCFAFKIFRRSDDSCSIQDVATGLTSTGALPLTISHTLPSAVVAKLSVLSGGDAWKARLLVTAHGSITRYAIATMWASEATDISNPV